MFTRRVLGLSDRGLFLLVLFQQTPHRPRLPKMLSRLPAGALKNVATITGARSSAASTAARSVSVRPRAGSGASPLTTHNNSVSGMRPRVQDLARPSRCVASSQSVLCVTRQARFQNFVNSRATLASATIAAVGSVAWYTHLYGTLPFIGEVHANAPEEDGLHPPHHPWSHSGFFDSFDHARYAASPRTPVAACS